MKDGLLIEVFHGSHDAILEFLFGRDTDVTQDAAGKFWEEALNEIEPGTVLGSEGEFEAVRRLRATQGLCLFGDVGGMTHHPHVHMIVPGGGIANDGSRWISCKPNFLLPVRMLSKLFRRLMLTKLAEAHAAGRMQFVGVHAHLTDAKAFAAFLAPLSKKRWFVYSKRPFAGPKAVLAYLSRYAHRVAISNRRLIAFDGRQVTFKVKDYRVEGPRRYTTMTLDVDEFIRRFLIYVLPKGFHRIRHYGLFAGSNRAETSRSYVSS